MNECGEIRGKVGEGDMLPRKWEHCVVCAEPDGEKADLGEASAVVALRETLDEEKTY